MELNSSQLSRAGAIQAGRLDRTLNDLRAMVKEQEAVSSKLRASSQSTFEKPSPDPQIQLRKLSVIRHALESCTPAEPLLPSSESALPSLLALRTVHKTIKSSHASLAKSERNLQNIEQRLQKEINDLQDAKLITRHLQQRCDSLQKELQERAARSPTYTAREMAKEIKRDIDRLDKETGKLIRSFNAFIDQHLASMLAAEELGGPVVGDMLDIDELTLDRGFNSQGTLKKQRQVKQTDKNQQKLDKMWPKKVGNAESSPVDESVTAATQMRELTEELLNTLVTDEGGDGYVILGRESAAARYLVRAKVALFHPRDAQKLRLIDFGRDLDD